jgi:hypothetical protein
MSNVPKSEFDAFVSSAVVDLNSLRDSIMSTQAMLDEDAGVATDTFAEFGTPPPITTVPGGGSSNGGIGSSLPGQVLFNSNNTVAGSDKLTFDPLTGALALGADAGFRFLVPTQGLGGEKRCVIDAVGADNPRIELRSRGPNGGVSISDGNPSGIDAMLSAIGRMDLLIARTQPSGATQDFGVASFIGGSDFGVTIGVWSNAQTPTSERVQGRCWATGVYGQAASYSEVGLPNDERVYGGEFYAVGYGPGTVDNLFCVLGGLYMYGGTATYGTGLHVRAPVMNGGVIANLCGLNIESQTSGTDSNYAVKTGLGKVQFGDEVTAPRLRLTMLPTTADGLLPGDLWNNAGVVSVVPGVAVLEGPDGFALHPEGEARRAAFQDQVRRITRH